MGIIHDHLSSRYQSYASWHEHPRRSHHHLFAVFVVAVLVGTGLYSSIKTVEISYAEVPDVQAVRSAPSVRTLTNQFFGLLKAYENAPEDTKAVALSQLESLLAKRAHALADLMEEHPELALLDVLPEDVINSLPAEIAAMLESYVTVEGPVAIFHEDHFEQGTTVTQFRVKDTSGKGDFVLRTSGNTIEAKPGDVLRVKGVSLRGMLLFAGGTGTVSSSGPSSFGISDSYSTGNKRILVMLITLTDNASQPYTAAQVQGIMFTNPDSVAAHYNESSYGTLTLSGDVVPQYIAVPYSSADVCGAYFDAAIAAAVAGAQAQGFNPANYQIHTVMNPPVGCRGGAAYYPGYTSSVTSMNNMYGQPSFQEVVEHELGHNLGENHSATYTCGSQSIANAGCSQVEYGDSLDPLGTYNGQHNHYNVAHKNGMGWFVSGNVLTVTGSGTYTIAPLEAATSAPQALRIAKSDTGQEYYVGYRQPVGMDAGLNANVMRGAGIWLTDDGATYPDLTRLLDMTPGDGNAVDSAMLADGQTFTDAANGLTITQLSHNSGGVTIQVTKAAAACVPGQTTAYVSPNTQTASADGATLQYTITVTNNDSSACEPSTYTLSGTVPGGWTNVFGAPTLTVNPGSSGNTTFRTTAPTGTANGSYAVAVTASGADAQHSAQASATHVIFLDATPPTVAITAPTNGAKLSGANTTLSATASDNVRVIKVEFYLDNTIQATDTSAPYSYKLNTRKVTSGAHTITVKAFDAAGNIGTASVSVTK